MAVMHNRQARILEGPGPLHPRIRRIVTVRQRLRSARQKIQIIGRIAVRADHGMIALRHQHAIVIAPSSGRRCCGRHCKRADKRSRRDDRSCKSRSLPGRLPADCPARLPHAHRAYAADSSTSCPGRIDLDRHDAMAIEAGRQDAVDLPRSVAAAAQLDRAHIGRDQLRGKVLIGRRPARGEFQRIAARGDFELLVTRQIDRRRACR